MMEEGTAVETKKEINAEIDTAVIDAEMIHVMTSGSSGSVTIPITLTQGGLVSLASPGQTVSHSLLPFLNQFLNSDLYKRLNNFTEPSKKWISNFQNCLKYY